MSISKSFKSILIRLKRQTWAKKIGEHYSGCLYNSNKFPFFWLVEKLLSRVTIGDEYVENLKSLSNKGAIVYVLKNKSQLNCLVLRNVSCRENIPKPVYCHGINMILWQPFYKGIRVFLSRLFYNPYKNEYLKRITRVQKCSIIYLHRSEFFTSKYVKDPLVQLIDAQKEMNVPIFLVPLWVAYGRKRGKKDKTITALLFEQTDNLGMFRRLITFFRHSKTTVVVSGDPINLAECIMNSGHSSLETMTCSIRRELIERIDGERRTIVGPVLKPRDEIIGTVLRDSILGKFMSDKSAAGQKDYQRIVNDAKKYLFEIAADYSETYIALWDKFLTWHWNNIYDGIVIDREGLARMGNIAKRGPFVVVPCHRSYVDYPVLSYVFYHNNIQMPFISAGVNLRFWPMGKILRKSGAFFLRKSFKGNLFYAKILERYIKALLEEGYPIEFFIEGGRNLAGKMVMPKYGLLSMVVKAFREGVSSDLAIIPAFIGYDRVIEEKSYLSEIEGAKKGRKNILSSIKSRKLFKKRHGSIYINFGEPIFLSSYFDSQEISIEEMDLSQRRSVYRKMGYEIANEINRISVVTPFTLVASGLLCHYRKGIAYNELMNIIDEFYDYLTFREVKFSTTFSSKNKALHNALNLYESMGFVSRSGSEYHNEEDEFSEDVYSVEEDKRLQLEYHKNNILHFFIPLCLVAVSILSKGDDEILLSRIMEDYSFLKRIFRHEFIFNDKTDDAEEVNGILSYIHEKGIILGREGENGAYIEVKGRGIKSLTPFSGLIQNYIESYWIAFRGSAYLKYKARRESDLIKNIRKLGVLLLSKGEVSKAEALSALNYQNALKFLNDAEIIIVSEGKKGKDLMLTLTKDKKRIESLRKKIFKFIV